MTGLLGWIDGAANVEAAATLVAMAQAAHVETPFKRIEFGGSRCGVTNTRSS